MDKVINIEEALKRIEELEKENAKLREELEYYRNRKLSGRQKHNAKWMAIYNDFVVGYESGMTMVEIAKRNNVSERTIYRYKAYYDKVFGGIYDDRLLVKPVPVAVKMMPDAEMEPPYDGAKKMILVDDVDNRQFLCELVESMWEELPKKKEKNCK